ncbi:MAG: hypothetical protein M3Y87_11925 [Myxococcota bacterium]|nr:hypothetical protein [Myxococcota bacterium]
MREHWPAFRERAEEHGGLPSFVVRDFEEYLRCGLSEDGLCHLACHGRSASIGCVRRATRSERIMTASSADQLAWG